VLSVVRMFVDICTTFFIDTDAATPAPEALRGGFDLFLFAAQLEVLFIQLRMIFL
jgi:hypothetical protein